LPFAAALNEHEMIIVGGRSGLNLSAMTIFETREMRVTEERSLIGLGEFDKTV